MKGMEKKSEREQRSIFEAPNIKPDEQQWEDNQNLFGFFSLLLKIDRRNKMKKIIIK